MYGANPGYVSSSFWRRLRCTEDLTFERALAGSLSFFFCQCVRVTRWVYSRDILLFEHFGGGRGGLVVVMIVKGIICGELQITWLIAVIQYYYCTCCARWIHSASCHFNQIHNNNLP